MADGARETAGQFVNTHAALADFWHPVALSSEVAGDPVGIVLAGEHWVLSRLDGVVVAFADSCPHRRARLSAGQIVGDTLRCGYHGWRFSADGTCIEIPALGDGASIPARSTLPRPAAVTERYGFVWLAPRTPLAPLPDLAPPSGEANSGTAFLTPSEVKVNAAFIIENFLDEAHVPFVHTATIGGAGPEPIERRDFQRRGIGFTATTEHTFTNRIDSAVHEGVRSEVQLRRLTYRYWPPFTGTLCIEYPDAGGWHFITLAVQAKDRENSRVYKSVTGSETPDADQAEMFAKYEQMIWEEDWAWLERAMSGVEFPLDLSADLHTKADRLSVEFRRILALISSGESLPDELGLA
ncbi:aromatic ring-hydroxylating oxygenase subunit alpha [Mycobacterium simiae]|uniref:aromatic ring-hydroxylating oxygenase subunit alpha n=1 Tax=Mycobacterium simiae TaxID=1784 RepID=UPI00165F3499|nr:aromatic ring-hydroxylating dioxygenase subunit alpha [Mycobacterium simiae]